MGSNCFYGLGMLEQFAFYIPNDPNCMLRSYLNFLILDRQVAFPQRSLLFSVGPQRPRGDIVQTEGPIHRR